MPNLKIPVETPESFCDIDFAKLAEYYGGPVDLITDIEGTVLPWGPHPEDGEIGLDVVAALKENIESDVFVGAHSITNRAGKGGQVLTALFSTTVKNINPFTTTLGEYPLNRSERKPSGKMSSRLAGRLYDDSVLFANPRRFQVPKLTVAFVGDKLSDMLEAEALHIKTGVTVVGFMVQRYGTTDHPADRFFRKRQKATASREVLKTLAANQFVR